MRRWLYPVGHRPSPLRSPLLRHPVPSRPARESRLLRDPLGDLSCGPGRRACAGSHYRPVAWKAAPLRGVLGGSSPAGERWRPRFRVGRRLRAGGELARWRCWELRKTRATGPQASDDTATPDPALRHPLSCSALERQEGSRRVSGLAGAPSVGAPILHRSPPPTQPPSRFRLFYL